VGKAEIDYIELCLGSPLPPDYRRFLTHHAAELRSIKDQLPLKAVLWTDPDDIIRGNQYARQHAARMLVGRRGRPWPVNYVVVGTNGAGDYWFVHREESKPGLWFWRHESGEVVQHHRYLREYLEALRAELQTPERWQPVDCDTHGRCRKGYVCQHLARGSGLGFHSPDDPERLNGWCDACERVRRRCGGWTDESETFARIALVCDQCFAAARARNLRHRGAAEPSAAADPARDRDSGSS
jgi:hypothetical protein